MQYHRFGKKGNIITNAYIIVQVQLVLLNSHYCTCILVQVKHKHFSLNVIVALKKDMYINSHVLMNPLTIVNMPK